MTATIPTNWIDASKDFTPKLINQLRYGQVLGFDKGLERTYYKVVRLNKRKGECWVKVVQAEKQDDGTLAVTE